MIDIEARAQGDDGAVGEFERRLDVSRRVHRRGVGGPGIDGIGAAHPRDPAEPVDQQDERVDSAVVQRADAEKRVGAVVPAVHPTNISGRRHELDGAQPAVSKKLLCVPLGVCSRRDRRTAEREVALAGKTDELGRPGRIERKRLFGEDMAVSGETRLGNRGVCGVARQVHHQRRGRVGKQRVHVGVDRRLAIVGGERGRAVAVAVTHRGQS